MSLWNPNSLPHMALTHFPIESLTPFLMHRNSNSPPPPLGPYPLPPSSQGLYLHSSLDPNPLLIEALTPFLLEALTSLPLWPGYRYPLLSQGP